MAKAKVFDKNEINMHLFSRTDTEGIIRLDHAIINGKRYYPEDLKCDTLKNVEHLLLIQNLFGFENKTD